MRQIPRLILVPALVALAACGRETASATTAADDALRNDLALAQAAQYRPQQFVSPMEQQGYAMQPGAAGYAQPQYQPAYAPAPVYAPAPAPAPVRRTAVRRPRSSGSVGSSGGGSGTIYAPAPAPRERIVKHTKRDAAIGAVAGAVIGATTSRDRIKGGVIGAAAGGILGAVIGNNVDKERVRY